MLRRRTTVPVVKSVTPVEGSYQEQLARLCELLHSHVNAAALRGREIVFIYDIDDTVVSEHALTQQDAPIDIMAHCFRRYVRQYATYYCSARPLVPGNEAITRSMLHGHHLSGFRDLKLRKPGAAVGPFKWDTCQELVSRHGRHVFVVRIGDMLWDTVPFPYAPHVAHLAGPHDGHIIELSNGIALLLPTPLPRYNHLV
tara:strand:+ start:44 stop:640 length:597 start_codon:yes stop_codon:yes gene_type:complete